MIEIETNADDYQGRFKEFHPLRWLRKLFRRRRCDFQLCEYPEHGVHFNKATGAAYAPIQNVIESELRRIRTESEGKRK